MRLQYLLMIGTLASMLAACDSPTRPSDQNGRQDTAGNNVTRLLGVVYDTAFRPIC